MRIVAVILAGVLASATALAQQGVPPPPQPAADSPANAEVLKYLRAGTSERVILHLISATTGKFDTSADALIALKQAGADDAELSAILAQGAAPANAPSANAAPANVPPAANGPSLEATMKYIEDKVNQQGEIAYKVFVRKLADNDTSSYVHFERSQVIAIDPAGGLSVQNFSGNPNHRDWAGIETWRLDIKDIWKLDVLSGSDVYNREEPAFEQQFSPQFFYLDIYLIGGRTVQKHVSSVVVTAFSGKHGSKTKSSDTSTGELRLAFRDEESADRAAKAFIHAVELCGGGSKPELF
jgi:hypothetical protein